MKKIMLAVLVCLAAVLTPGTAFANTTGAVTAVTPGLTVSPAVEQLNLTSNQKTVRFNSQITNNTANQLVVNISTTDFTALNETGGIVFLPNLTNRPHGLAQWLKPAVNQVVVSAGASQTVPVSVISTAKLAPGGHYGALVYRVIASGSALKGNQVSNNEEISSLVFLTTASGGVQSLSLGKLSAGRVMLKIPSSINLVLTNTGNTQTAPNGLVTIINGSNKEIARGVINPDSGLVLPGTSRLYAVSLRPETKLTYPGDYRLLVFYQAGPNAKASVYITSFLLVNRSILIGAAVLAVLIAALIIRRLTSGIIYRRPKA